MYFLLKENYALRGWAGIPYALLDITSGRMQILDEFLFSVISLCNGKIDSTILLPPHMESIKKLENNEIVESFSFPSKLKHFQKYKLASCKYISTAHWSITGKCNLKCRHCYMSAPQGKFGELTKKQCFDIIAELCEANIHTVSLTGGEPLIRKDLWEIVDRLHDNKIHVSQIYTNGVLINEELISSLQKRSMNPEFSISFDGVGYHDWIRGVEGIEEKVLEAIKLLVKNGYKVSVEMSLNKKNIHTLTRSIFLLASLGVSQVKATPTTDSGNWINESDSTITTHELYEAYLEFIPEYKVANAPIEVMLGGFFFCEKDSTDYIHPFKKYNGSEEMLDKSVCGSARANMYIAADGKLLPCIPLSGMPIQETMPNVLDMPLIDILSDSVYLKVTDTKLRDLLVTNTECNSCDQKLYCGGGCRAGALICGNEYLGKDESTCYFFKNGYEQKVKDIYS